MLRRTTLKRGKQLNHISKHKLQELNQEVNDRLALCNRAGGQPYCHTKTIKISGKPHQQTVVTCYNGTCEICGKHADILSPHEKRHRSLMGKLSKENTVMVCYTCHIAHQNDAKSPFNDVRKARVNTTRQNEQGKVSGNGL